MSKSRVWGGITGALIAVAGGVGAAVGLYSLPDPSVMDVHAHAYARIGQRAEAVIRYDNGDGTTTRIHMEATLSEAAGFDNPGDEGGNPPYVINDVSFSASEHVCNDFGCERVQEWGTALPMSAFQFDPAMGSAHVSAVAGGCSFDIDWVGEDQIAPISGFESHGTQGAWHAERDSDGYAELSRVAPASVDACFGSFDDVPGFLSQGARRAFVHGGVFERQPEE